jgi:radical SAM superfamily enzyme YgiQ (UPF0313 family)
MKILYLPHEYNQQRQREKKRWIWPVHLAMEATYRRNEGDVVYWDAPDFKYVADKIVTDIEGLPFLELPAADRLLTKAYRRKYQNNGNYKHHPGTYIQSAAGCWWGKCKFCKERHNAYQLRPVDDVITEIRECARLGYNEIFDDAASLGVGEWRKEFIAKLKPLDVTFSCNMRFGTLKGNDFLKLKDAGFRMLLYGLESANQVTLDKVNKGTEIDRAVHELEMAAKYGLEPHIACIFGYPWETDEDAMRTLKLVQYLLRKGYAKTAQASVYDVEGTGYDISARKYLPQIYHAALYPDFWINKLRDVRNLDDIKYIWRGVKACFGM